MVSLNCRTSIAMTDSLLALAGRCYASGTTTSARAKNKKDPKPGACPTFPHEAGPQQGLLL